MIKILNGDDDAAGLMGVPAQDGYPCVFLALQTHMLLWRSYSKTEHRQLPFPLISPRTPSASRTTAQSGGELVLDLSILEAKAHLYCLPTWFAVVGQGSKSVGVDSLRARHLTPHNNTAHEAECARNN